MVIPRLRQQMDLWRIILIRYIIYRNQILNSVRRMVIAEKIVVQKTAMAIPQA